MPSGRYLLESGAPDGYLLEDGSGVLLQDPALAFVPPVASVVSVAPTDPQTWNHTVPADCRAFVVFAGNQTSATDRIVGVTVGGVALTRMRREVDTALEPGGVDLWFVGSGIPTGVQVVSVDFTAVPGDDYVLVSMAFIGDNDTEVISTAGLSEDQADPAVTLAHLGRLALDVMGIASGHGKASDLLDRDGQWRVLEDWSILGTRGEVVSQTPLSILDATVGYFSISGFADDCAFAAMAIAEILTQLETPRSMQYYRRRRLL